MPPIFKCLICRKDIERSTKTFWNKKGHLLCSSCLDNIDKKSNKVLPWNGRYLDGFNNKITMHAYANPDSDSSGSGYGIIKFNKKKKEVTFECWPRYQDVRDNNAKQFKGWPVTVSLG